ncbi:C-C chemokine receptor type 1-like [Littorina saxatilis]|uniref:C-C chemokine receptor type 1-like n=1 Tax=Littorina saxatilis TaxID=31220 RepID=UPI0038B4C405
MFPDVLVNETNVTSNVLIVTAWKDLYTVVMYHIPVAMAVDRYTTPVCCVIGFVGNIISVRIWVMRRMRKCNSSASYLATLAVSDLLFLLLVIPNELWYAWLVSSLELQGWCQLWNVLYMTTQYFSLLLVCAFTLERFLSVCRPFDCQRFAKTSRSAKVIVGIFCVSVLLSLPQGFFWTINAHTSECQLREGDYEIYGFWNWASEIVMFGLLPILALILNICVLRQIRSVGRLYVTEASSAMMIGASSRCATTTITLLWISFYLIFTKLPVTIVYSMQTTIGLGGSMSLEAMGTDPVWQRYLTYFSVRKVIEEVGISHHACNIFIYCLTSRQFRKHLRLLCWDCVSCQEYENSASARTPPSNKTNKNGL